MKKKFKENKFTVIVFIIFLALFIFGAILFNVIVPQNGKPQYGNRLEGIEKVLPEKDRAEFISTMKSALEKEDEVNSVSVDIKGRIINLIVEVKKGTKVKTAKNLTDVVTKEMTEAQLGYFDIQIFIKNSDKDAKGYPVIGYKGSELRKFTFSGVKS